MAGRLASVSSWAVAPLALVLLVAAVVVGGRSLGGDASAWLFVPVSVPFALVGALLTRRRPGNPVGWLIAGWGLVMAYRVFAQAYAGAAASTPDRLPGAEWLAWVGTWLWHPAFSLLAFLLLLFPHGRLVSARARVLVWVIVGTYGLLAVAAALSPSAEDDYFPGSAPPFRSPIGGVADVAFAILLTAQLAVLLAAMASLLIRLRRSDGEERQQIKWFIYTVAVTVVVFVAGVFVLGGGFLFPVFAAIPVSAAVAVLRYRLYDIDRIVSRTVSYAAVTGVLIALYVGLVTAFGQLVGSSSLSVAAATLAVAALFQPLRQRVQAGVDRRFNRARYDAAGVVEVFSQRLRHEVNLETLSTDLVAVVRQTVQPAAVSLWLRR